MIGPVHESLHPVPGTDSEIAIPNPDQGTPHVVLSTPPVGQIDVWEPFEDGTKGGHNLFGFLERWRAFVAGTAPDLSVYDPRFGFPALIPRSAIDKVTWIDIGYRRREDTRAGHRSSLALAGGPDVRQVAPGEFEIRVPR